MSEERVPYNVTIPNELTNLRAYLQAAAHILANIPEGETLKQQFDTEYARLRLAHQQRGELQQEIEAARRVAEIEAGLK